MTDSETFTRDIPDRVRVVRDADGHLYRRDTDLQARGTDEEWTSDGPYYYDVCATDDLLDRGAPVTAVETT